MAKIDVSYSRLLSGIKEHGYKYKTENRPDVEMIQVTSANFEHELTEFPILTTKEVNFKAVVGELLWFLKGENNIKFLLDRNINIWNKDAYQYYLRICEKADSEPGLDINEFIAAVKGDALCTRDGYDFGDIGRNYGVQWRDWRSSFYTEDEGLLEHTTDQITVLIENLRKPNPINRRHIVTAWNPAELDHTALPPCHWAFEILPRPLNYRQKMNLSGGDMEYLDGLWDSAFLKNDEEAKKLLDNELQNVPNYGFTLKWFQRSSDVFLGLPFNIASYGLLANIISSMTGMAALAINPTLSNVHIYGNHLDAVDKQLNNLPTAFAAPILSYSDNYIKAVDDTFNGEFSFDEFINKLDIEDFILTDYKNFGKIKAEMIAPSM